MRCIASVSLLIRYFSCVAYGYELGELLYVAGETCIKQGVGLPTYYVLGYFGRPRCSGQVIRGPGAHEYRVRVVWGSLVGARFGEGRAWSLRYPGYLAVRQCGLPCAVCHRTMSLTSPWP